MINPGRAAAVARELFAASAAELAAALACEAASLACVAASAQSLVDVASCIMHISVVSVQVWMQSSTAKYSRLVGVVGAAAADELDPFEHATFSRGGGAR